MIQLNVDFVLLNKYFGIAPSKIFQYANKDFEEIMEIEASQGNAKAANYKEILSNPDKLIQIFRLSNLENKMMILQNLSETDLDELLPYLSQEQLTLGLQFFTEEKLMMLCEDLPTEDLLVMLYEKFTTLDILSFMDDATLNTFLYDPSVDREYSQAYFEQMDEQMLKQIMMQQFGYEYKDKTRAECLETMNELSNADYLSFITSLDAGQKMLMIDNITQQNEDLLMLFDNKDLIAPMGLLMKPDKIKLMSNLAPEHLVEMNKQLPPNLTQIVASQIDPQDFAEILARDFQDVLAQVVLFSTKS